MKVKTKKVEGATLTSKTGKVQYLWAITGIYNMTLVQVYSPTEPISLVQIIQDRYDNK